MKVALVQAPGWWTVDPPLGLAQVAGALSSAGLEPAVFDLNILFARSCAKGYEGLWNWEQFQFWNLPPTVERFFADHAKLVDEQVEAILETDAKVVGFSVYAGTHLASLELARRLKRADPGRSIVFGGQYFHLDPRAPELLADPAVDAVVRGDGDLAFPALAATWGPDGLRPVPGSLVKTGGRVADGGPEPELKDLDAVPFADFRGFPLELYDVKERLPIHASRGCVWKCRFCSAWPFWSGYRYMSGDRVFAEIMHHKRLFPWKTHFEFYDITANGSVRTLERLADLVLEDRAANGKTNFFGWKINAILRPEMTPEVLRKLRAAECHDIIYGVESGSPKVRKLMNKPFTNETAAKVLKDTHDAGIVTIGNFMFGYPGESEEDFQETLGFLRGNRGSFDRVYASATFTSLEEHSTLSEHRKELGIREETGGRDAHHLYWESEDGTNTYLVRLDRYERFRKLAIELGLDAYKGVQGGLEQDKRANLAGFYRYRGEHLQAVRNLLAYLENDLYSEPMRAELSAYAQDLAGLARAAKAVERANRNLEASQAGTTLSAARAANGVPPPEEPVRRLWRALRALSGMRDRAELESSEGGIRLVWGAAGEVERGAVESLLERARLLLGLAESEIRSGASAKPAPACKR